MCVRYINSLDEAVQLMIIKAGKALKRGEEVGSIAKTLSLKCFQTAPANMRSVSSQLVVFAYSHFN